MGKPLRINVDPSRTPVYSVLIAAESPVAAILKKVERSMKRPLDSACLLLVLRQVAVSVRAAMELLPDWNDKATQLLEELGSLHEACASEYKQRAIADSYATLERQLTRYRGWATFAFLADTKAPLDGARVVATGMEIALKLIATAGNPRVADAHMRDLATGRPDLDMTAYEMLQQIHHNFLDPEDLPKWFKRADTNFHKFCQAFQQTPPPPPPKPTFEQIATARWRAQMAHPSFRQRAAILDQTCLNTHQIQHLLSGQVESQYAPGLLKTLLWLAGFSGLAFDWIKDIPIADPSIVHWRAYLDIRGGIFWRDFTSLAPSAAKAIPESNAVPASYCAALPIPEEALEFLQERLRLCPTASSLGDLVPELRSITSTQSIYKTSGDIQPTWARWVRTVGVHLRQSRLESLLVSVLTGNFGHIAKSKLYYCSVTAEEIWEASTRAYIAMSFGAPATMPNGLLNFGSNVVPTLESVRAYGLDMVAVMEGLRPVGKAHLSRVIDFHNEYARALGYRFMCLLGLRSSSLFDLFASIDEYCDDTIDVDDKTTGGKPGGLPVVLCQHLKQLIALYRKHCLAMHARLHNQPGCLNICVWLKAVMESGHVPLLCTISNGGHPRPMGTADIIDSKLALADDFGRKVIENWTRRHHALTRDSDRMLRHEVLGQESNNSASDHSEFEWVKRLSPVMEQLASELFPVSIHGLRSK